MPSVVSSSVSQAALSGSMREFRVPRGDDLLERVGAFYKWQDERRKCDTWPYSRAAVSGANPTATVEDDAGRRMQGVNFASQDYLSLSQHPAIKEAAMEAAAKYGVHSAGSAALVGAGADSIALEKKIGEFVQMEDVVLYPTGFGAGYGVIRGLVRSGDHIVIDALAQSSLQEGAIAATRNIYAYRHLDVEHCRERLKAIRSRDAENGVMVVTEALFSMESDTPDLAALQELCREYKATLLVDVAHDLGALGPGGRGHIATQNMIGKIDLVLGSFSKSFASNGGFVACRARSVKEYLRFYSPTTAFSNALSPIQAAVVLKAFEIVDSAEGEALRNELMTNVFDLRQSLTSRGLEYYGDPSAIVAVKMGSEAMARLVARRLPAAGLLANLVEYPAVGKNLARLRMQAMAKHSAANIRQAVDIIAECFAAASHDLAETAKPRLSAFA